MKYLLILIANCLFILYSIMFFVDHRLVPEETSARIRNLLLMCTALYVSYNVLFIYILNKENEQSGIIYKIAAGVKYIVTNSCAFIQPFQEELIMSFIIAAGIIVISFILLGLPGGLILGIIQKLGIGKSIEGDNVWPAALYVSFFWPLCFPIAVFTKNYFIQNGYIEYALPGLCAGALVWMLAVIISALFVFK